MNLSHQIQLTFEDNKVQRRDGRFINQSPDVSPSVFNSQQFVGANYTFGYKNADNAAFPTLGLEFMLNANWKATLSDFNRNFLTLNGKLAIDHRIDKKGNFVFANSSNAMWINNNHFEFYQAAAIGGNNGMRAFRNERFSGRSYFINNSEIRWDFGRIRNNIVPAITGMGTLLLKGKRWDFAEVNPAWVPLLIIGWWRATIILLP